MAAESTASTARRRRTANGRHTCSCTVGEQTEKFAKEYLLQQGLTHVASNYRCRKGEIDLIMLDKGQLVFIEVKYRRNQRYGSGFDVVTASKQRKVIETARYYLHDKKLTESISCRFDIVSLEPTNNTTAHTKEEQNYTTHWLKNAFYSE